MEEQELVQMLLRREEDALEELQRRYGAYCAAVAGGILADAGEVEQVLNDTWLRAWDSIPPNRPGNLKLYLARIARNLSLNRLDYLHADKRAVPLRELETVIPDRYPEEQALKDALERFLRSLKPEHRQMFLRRYWFGDSLPELARRFGTTTPRVNGILSRTRRQLKQFLQQEGLQ